MKNSKEIRTGNITSQYYTS